MRRAACHQKRCCEAVAAAAAAAAAAVNCDWILRRNRQLKPTATIGTHSKETTESTHLACLQCLTAQSSPAHLEGAADQLGSTAYECDGRSGLATVSKLGLHPADQRSLKLPNAKCVMRTAYTVLKIKKRRSRWGMHCTPLVAHEARSAATPSSRHIHSAKLTPLPQLSPILQLHGCWYSVIRTSAGRKRATRAHHVTSRLARRRLPALG